MREIAAWDLVNVEAIPFDVLSKGIKWEWETFPEYMDAAAKRGSGINLGFLAPLTPFRHYVMGEESMERAATVDGNRADQSADQGSGRGGRVRLYHDHRAAAYRLQGTSAGLPQRQPRRVSSAYANALRELGRGAMELALTKSVSIMSDEEYEFLDFLLTESGRPVTWLALLNRDDMPEACQETLRQAEPLIRRGGVPQVTCRPLIIQIDLRNPFIFANLASWNPVFNQPKEVQEKIYRDSNFRNAFREALKKPDIFSGKWERLEVKEVFTPCDEAARGPHGRRDRAASAARTASIPSSTSRSKTICKSSSRWRCSTPTRSASRN